MQLYNCARQSGKSQVAAILQELGAELIDADRVAHELLEPDTAEYERIVERFGRDVLQPSGAIDRRKLGAVVFADADALRDLEQILHPGLYLETDAVWVVTADRETQIERLLTSRGLTRAEAETRVDAQPPQSEKVARADVVIDNSGDLARTREQVLAAWEAIQNGTAPSRRGEVR